MGAEVTCADCGREMRAEGDEYCEVQGLRNTCASKDGRAAIARRNKKVAAKLARMAKRGYSRDFTPQTDRRIKIDIDRVPPTLAAALKAKVKREGLSVRSVTLNLWKKWVEGE